jgi:hypothetical protein
MRSWKGECSRAFTDWRGLHFGVESGAWLVDDTSTENSLAESTAV